MDNKVEITAKLYLEDWEIICIALEAWCSKATADLINQVEAELVKQGLIVK